MAGAKRENIVSRRHVSAHTPGMSVTVGWDNPLATFFAQVTRDIDADGDGDPIVLWIGGTFGEAPRAEDLVAPLAPYASLTPEMVAQLRADRAACADRGPSRLQRDMLRRTAGR
jgi:hypothetical protein